MPSELTWRPVTTDDLDGLFDLIDRIQTHDAEHERLTRADLDTIAGRPWIDLAQDSLMGVDAVGVARAWGRTSFRPGDTPVVTVHLMGGVDPDWRGQGHGRRVLAWAEDRAPANVAFLRGDQDLPAQIGGFVENHLTGRRHLFEAAGFTASRVFSELRLRLGADLPAPDLPDPLELVPYDDGIIERVRVAHNIAFASHWGFTAYTPETWATNTSDAAFRPELSAAIVDTSTPATPVVGFVLNSEYEHDWVGPDDREGYIEYLGVVPEWRSRGLATTLLNLAASRFTERGHPHAALGVDTDNSTGALRLYESLGYQLVHQTTYLSKEV